MALPPAIISAGSAAVVAVSPALAVPVLTAYAANMAVRAAFRVAEHSVEVQQSEALARIASAAEGIEDDVSSVLSEIKTLTARMSGEEDGVFLADAVRERGSIPDELHVHINNDHQRGNDERWTVKDRGA